jgi:tetratricopeptide (TPR) repeat protein
MLRYLFLVSVLVQFSIVQAQNSVVTNAILYRNDGNLLKAKEEIDKACSNEKTSQSPKSWYYKGLIYKDISQSQVPAIMALDSNALNTSFSAFTKVSELEVPPGEYVSKSSDGLTELWGIYINTGAKNYESGMYFKALNQFEHAQEIKPKDTTAYIYALYAAERMNNSDLIIRYCNRLINIGYKSPDVYYHKIEYEFDSMKDPEKAFSLSRKALQEYPDDKRLFEQQTDMYMRMNKNQEALTNLLKLSDKNPKDIPLLTHIAVLYEKLKDKKNARQYYLKILQLDSLNYVANYDMAVYSYTESYEIEDRINTNDSIQTSMNKLYKITDYSKDPLRVELKIKLDQAQNYYTKAIGNCHDESERRNLHSLYDDIKKAKVRYSIPDTSLIKK